MRTKRVLIMSSSQESKDRTILSIKSTVTSRKMFSNLLMSNQLLRKLKLEAKRNPKKVHETL